LRRDYPNAERFDVPRELWYVWHRSELGLTKISPQVGASELGTDSATEMAAKGEQVVRMLVEEDRSSVQIFDVSRSLMSVLGN
jgi:hypothetical protein